MAIDVAQGMVDKAFSDQSLLPTNQNQSQPDPLAILSSNATNEGGDSAYDGSSFAKDMFGVEDPSQILHLVGPHPNDPERVVYEMNGKKYGAPKDKPLDAVLESIWDKNSPGLWGSAVGSTLYGLPADMASAVAYGLGGLNLGEDAQEWRNYSDKLKEEYYQKYGQFMVPGVDAAMRQGKVFDYAMQTIGSGTPYMGLALAGGLGGGAAVGAAGMATTTAEGGLTLAGALGSFLGSTAVTSPVTIAQFADRQVAEQKAQGIENPEIDWGRAAALGTIAAGLQAVPAESILFGGPLLKTLEAWGAKTGTSASARILASIGDVAGSNALAGAGIAALSRFNADLPMLDDGAKSEYVDAAIAGSLVGIPFGAYHGIRSKSRAHLPHIDENRPVDDILGEVGDKPDLPNSPKGSGGAETVYTGPDDFNTTLKLPGRKGLIYDPTYDYGIKDFADASNYLNSINYKRPDGTEGNGLNDFVYTWEKAKKPYSDEDMIEAARRAKWARDRQGNLARSKDGMMYETIMDLPQVHSDEPIILSKAAALTDKFGYDDTFVRGLSDKIIEKLYERNVAGELGRAANGVKYPKEVFDQVMEKLRNHVDEDVVKDVQQYGSLYQRPQSKEREKNRLSQIRARVNRNPRRDLAEALMNTRRQQAGARAKAAAEGQVDSFPIRQPFYGDENMDIATSPKQAYEIMGKYLGEAQRGDPELAMMGAQSILSGGVLSSLLEHIGDISHRISHLLKYDNVMGEEKVIKGLRTLQSKYGFEREHNENLKVSFEHHKSRNSLPKGVETFDQYKALVDKVVNNYANEHAKLPVFNKAQWLAREAAVTLGRGQYKKTISHLKALDKIFKSKDSMEQFKDYRVNERGKIVTYTPDNPLFKQPRLKITPKSGRSEFIEQPPVDGEAFGPYAGLRKEPLGPRALLSFSGAKPEKVVETLVKAANRPGGFATKNMTKKQFAEFLFNTPFVKNLMKVWTNKDPYDPASGKPFDPKKNYTLEEAWGIMESGRKERQKMAAAAKLAAKKAAYPEPKLDAAGDPILKGPAHGGFRPTEYAKSGSYKFKALPEAEELIGKLRSRMEEIATQDRAAYLKDYPELGPALNQMAKAFAEMKPDIEIKGPRTKAIKGTKGFTESLARRAKVLDSVAHSLQNIGANKQVGDHFSTLVDHLIGGKEVTPRELSDGVTLLEAAFNINEKGTFEKGTLDATAIQNMYKTIRQNLGKKNIEKLNNKRQFLEDWYKEQHKINDADIASINTEDLEATAFFHYLDDSLKAKYKDFKDSPQKKLFESLEKSFKKLKNDLGNQGFEKVDDFFEYNNEAMNDKISSDTQRSGTAKRIVEDANFKAAQEEVKQANENAKAAAAERIADAPPPPKPPSNGGGSGGDGRFPKFNKVYKDHVDDVQSGMYRLWSTIASVPYLARHVEEWAIHFNDLQKQAHDQAAYDLRFTTKLTQLMHGPRKDRVWQEVNDAASLISHMRKSGQVLEKDAQGRYLIRNKDGELRAVDMRTTEAMDDLIDFIKEPMRVGRDIARNNLGRLYKDDGIHAGSSIEHIKRVIKDYDNRIDGNPFPAEASRLRMKKEALESSLQDIKEFEDHIDTKIPYIPYMRFGDHAVMVTNRKTGKKEYLGTINDVNKISHTTRNLTEQEVQQKINELGLREKYNTNDYEITHFKMTYDNIGRYIGRNAISTELLQGLIASGLNEHIKLADHLATDIKDAKEVMSDIRDAVKGSKERALKYMSSRGIGRFGLKSENIEGHSTDWARVLEAYKNIYSSHLAKKGKMIDLIEHQAALQEKGVPQYLAKRINNYLDYVNSPESDYAGLRTFNFVFAMGFNPASAILQLATIPNQVFGASLEFSPNILHNMSLLANETQRAIRYALPLYGMRIEKLDPYYESIINSEPGFFRASVKHDAMANKIMGYSETSTLRSRIAQNAADYGAMFIAPMERVTRISSFTFFHKALKENPANMERFIKAHEKDFNWQQFYENYKDTYDNETIAALYKMQETHAVFGKTARGTLQKGLGGSLFFPFSSYGQQMLEVMADQFMGHRGTAGRMAGLWSTTAFVAMAGLAGIPAYELLKTLYETYEEKVHGRIADAEMDMKEGGWPDWLRKGILSSATGLSLSHRLGQTLVGESLLQGLIQGEVKVGDLGGVPGRIMQNTITAAGALMDESDNRDVIQKLIPIMPTAAANLAKAYELTVHPENQLRTGKGKAFASPDDVGFNEIGATAMGFTPQKFEDARQKLHWQQQANVEFNQARSRFAESVAQALYQREVAIKNGDSEGASQALLQRNQIQKTMLEFMRNNKIPAGGDFWSSFNQNVRDRLMSKRFPGKILKPTRGEMRHLDVLKEDDR